MTRNAIRRLWLIGGLIGLALTLAASLGNPVLDARQGHADKLAHGVGYALLMLWWAQIIPVSHRLVLALGLTAFGGVIELLQGMTPHRSPDLLDLLANTLGILAGWRGTLHLPNLVDLVFRRMQSRL